MFCKCNFSGRKFWFIAQLLLNQFHCFLLFWYVIISLYPTLSLIFLILSSLPTSLLSLPHILGSFSCEGGQTSMEPHHSVFWICFVENVIVNAFISVERLLEPRCGTASTLCSWKRGQGGPEINDHIIRIFNREPFLDLHNDIWLGIFWPSFVKITNF